MAKYFILPDNNDDTVKKDFSRLLDRQDETLVLVLWDDDTAVEASDHVKKIVDANEGDMGFYRFVNFVIIPNPNPIIPILEKLENSSDFDLADIDQSVIISISPFRNIISEVVTKNRFNKGKGSVSTAIVTAMANG